MPSVSGFTIAASVTTNTESGYTLAQFSTFYVPTGVNIFATGQNFSGIDGQTANSIENNGNVVGNAYGMRLGAVASFSTLINNEGGRISNGSFGTAAVSFANSGANAGANLINHGVITGNSGSPAVLFNATGQINNTGTISASPASGGTIQNVSSLSTDSLTLNNMADGIIIGGYSGVGSQGTETIINAGAIRGNVTFGNANNAFMSNSGTLTSGTLTFGNGNNARYTNFGGMGSLVVGTGNNDYIENFGTINGNVTINGAGALVINTGRINGVVTLNGANGIFNSTHGTLYSNTEFNPKGAMDGSGAGTVIAGNNGSTIVGAMNGSLLYGGNGNDVLIANQTQDAAVSYHAMTLMNGGAGTNAMYGGGGINNFESGNSTYNQIWGGASQMADYTGYTNNTLSYAGATAGVYVDLQNGHNAYIGNTAGKSWTGSGRFEDSIQHVPNVIGSAFGDVIQSDAAGGRITGGVGADALYAGGGPDTFVYNSTADSNLNTGYDTIVGFNLATDKIDLTAFRTDGTHLAISTAGTSNTVYWEVTPGVFNPSTDLALVVNTTTTGGLTAANFIF